LEAEEQSATSQMNTKTASRCLDEHVKENLKKFVNLFKSKILTGENRRREQEEVILNKQHLVAHCRRLLENLLQSRYVSSVHTPFVPLKKLITFGQEATDSVGEYNSNKSSGQNICSSSEVLLELIQAEAVPVYPHLAVVLLVKNCSERFFLYSFNALWFSFCLMSF
jgi:hypothetical protein